MKTKESINNYLTCFNQMYNDYKINGFFLNYTKSFNLNDHTLSLLKQLNKIKALYKNSGIYYVWIGKKPNELLVIKIKNLMSQLVKDTPVYNKKQ